MWGWDPIGEMWWLFAVGNIVFWVLVGLLVLALIIRPRGGGRGPPVSNALQILEERYAHRSGRVPGTPIHTHGAAPALRNDPANFY